MGSSLPCSGLSDLRCGAATANRARGHRATERKRVVSKALGDARFHMGAR